jgi:anti-anti-sigma regulatory factor
MIFASKIECNLNHRQGGISMASNFKIFPFETRDSLHLKLDGDFDGNSAHELLNTLKKYGDGFYQIFIDTNDLKTIHPFGKEVFQKNLGAFKNQSHDIVFIGRNESELKAD